MINIIHKKDCCGCNACVVACPKSCIRKENDNEGFWYPVVNTEACIHCNICEKVCPELSKADNVLRYKAPKVYAAYHKDEFTRIDSTSGGLFSALANKIFDEGGYVGGAVYNKDHTVSHILTSDKSRLKDIRSSKYLQSDTENLYPEIKKKLKENHQVFVCGTPCQIQALYKYLGKEYDNLYTADFICRGVNSPKVFLKYMDMLEKKHSSRATEIKFKAKKWGWHNFSMRVRFENGQEYCQDKSHDLFFIGYLRYGGFARPSCYECSFKGFPQKGDITLADFWGIENIDKTMDQDKGTSLVMVNSDKGQSLLESIQDSIVIKEFTYQEAEKENQALNLSLKPSANNRTNFFDYLDTHDFEKTAAKFFDLKGRRAKWKRRWEKLCSLFKR